MVSFGKNRSSQQSYVWDEQIPFLQDLYNAGQDLLTSGSPGVEQFAKQYTGQFLPEMEQAALSTSNTDFINTIKNGTNLGMTTMASMMNPQGNPYLEDQIGSMWGSIGRNLDEYILPNQRSEASVTGNYGSSRDFISEGMAKQRAIESGVEAEKALRFGAYGEDMNRALTAAGTYTGAGTEADKTEAARLSLFPAMAEASYNLGMTPYTAPFDYLGEYRDVIGSPTVLGEGSSGGFNLGILTG